MHAGRPEVGEQVNRLREAIVEVALQMSGREDWRFQSQGYDTTATVKERPAGASCVKLSGFAQGLTRARIARVTGWVILDAMCVRDPDGLCAVPVHWSVTGVSASAV